MGDDLAVDVTGASAEPFEQQPSPVVEAAAEPEESADEEQIGLEAAVAAVRAHGDEAVRDREIRDELEGLTSRESGAEEDVVPVEPVEAFGFGVAGPAATIDIADQPVVQVAGEPFVQAAEAQESPFQAPRQADAPPPVNVVEDVFAITPAPPREVVREPETVVVPVEISAVRRAAGRALAQVGEVRELELEVPVPSGWTGGRRMTLQLRLTLVPQEEGHER